MSSRTLQPVAGAVSLGFIALLLAAPAFAGTVYQWKDAKGVTHYSDSPPPAQQGVQNRHLKDGPAPTYLRLMEFNAKTIVKGFLGK